MSAPDWTSIGARLATNEHARDAAGASLGREITRAQLIRWRKRTTRPFPQPVLLVPARGGAVELWDREDIAFWLERELAAVRLDPLVPAHDNTTEATR